MVRLDQEWYYIAMRVMNVRIVRFFSGKMKECVGSMCRTIERTDRVIQTVRIRTQTVAIPQWPSHDLY
jgi:hypothetical protein